MNIKVPLLLNSDDKPSFTVTMFFIAFNTGIFKLLLSGMTIWGFTFEKFTGVDLGAVILAAGSIYGYSKYLDIQTVKKETNEGNITKDT